MSCCCGSQLPPDPRLSFARLSRNEARRSFLPVSHTGAGGCRGAALSVSSLLALKSLALSEGNGPSGMSFLPLTFSLLPGTACLPGELGAARDKGLLWNNPGLPALERQPLKKLPFSALEVKMAYCLLQGRVPASKLFSDQPVMPGI